MKYFICLLCSTVILAFPLAGFARVPAATAPMREPHCGHDAICGLKNPEDVVRLGDSHFAIASSFARARHSVSHLYLVDLASRTAKPLVPTLRSSLTRSLAAGCAPPKSFRTMITHGLSVRSDGPDNGRLYVINQGGKQSVEMFGWRVRGNDVALNWRGCVPVPSEVYANAVAPLPGGVAVTSFGSPADPQLVNLIAGRPSGFVMIWTSNTGWTRVRGSELPGDNGIEVSPDGNTLYVDGWADDALWVLSRDESRPPIRIPVGDFHPDNVHWLPGGKLLIAGEVGDPSRILSCGPRTICRTPSMIVVFDPIRDRIILRQKVPPTVHFGAASTALRYRGRYWLSSFLGDRMIESPLAGVTNATPAPVPSRTMPLVPAHTRVVTSNRVEVYGKPISSARCFCSAMATSDYRQGAFTMYHILSGVKQ